MKVRGSETILSVVPIPQHILGLGIYISLQSHFSNAPLIPHLRLRPCTPNPASENPPTQLILLSNLYHLGRGTYQIFCGVFRFVSFSKD